MNTMSFRAVVLVAVLLLSASCDRSRSRIVGKWKVVGDSSEVVWDFSKNGNVNFGDVPGRYSFGDGHRIKIQTPTATFVHQLDLEGDRMIWKDPDGKTTELARVK